MVVGVIGLFGFDCDCLVVPRWYQTYQDSSEIWPDGGGLSLVRKKEIWERESFFYIEKYAIV